MFEIGRTLRQARERLRLSVQDAALATRIRSRYLQALEDEKWFLLPGRAYTKAFLREYAEYLGLDSDLIVDEYVRAFPPEDESEFVARGLPARRDLHLSPTTVSLVCVAILAAVAWKIGGSNTEVAPAAPPPLRQERTRTARPTARPQAVEKPATARANTLVVRAPAHASWIEVHDGDTRAGRTLFRGDLAAGQKLTFRLGRVWMRIGAPDNLHATINGKRLQLPGDTANVLFTHRGARVI